MASVPEQLRQARADRNLSVEQVAEITKLRADHVRALEEGNYAFFAAPVYVRGFVRSYASLLRLDLPEVMSALERELGSEGRPADLGSSSEPARGLVDGVMLQLSKLDLRKSLVGAGVLALLAVLVIVWISWRYYGKTDPLQGIKPGVYQSTQHVSGETLPLPGSAPKR